MQELGPECSRFSTILHIAIMCIRGLKFTYHVEEEYEYNLVACVTQKLYVQCSLHIVFILRVHMFCLCVCLFVPLSVRTRSLLVIKSMKVYELVYKLKVKNGCITCCMPSLYVACHIYQQPSPWHGA